MITHTFLNQHQCLPVTAKAAIGFWCGDSEQAHFTHQGQQMIGRIGFCVAATYLCRRQMLRHETVDTVEQHALFIAY